MARFQTVKGTKDVLPTDAPKLHRLETIVRSAFERYNYREIRTPLFEETALFARGIGVATDVVMKEMYTFTDRGGLSVTLRPEMTASVVRAYVQHALGGQMPLQKLWYMGPMFRQENVQKGRLRQFHQFGAEAIGSDHASVDAEMIALMVSVFRAFGLDGLTLRLNSVGDAECRPAYKAALQEHLRPNIEKLSAISQTRFETNPLRILDSKSEADQALLDGGPVITDFLNDRCRRHFQEVRGHLDRLNIAYTLDPKLVRGLDYYTMTAFELISTDLGAQNALGGGGRYDRLIGELGGKPTPAVGWAAGVERLMIALEERKFDFGDGPAPAVYIVAIGDGARQAALPMAVHLREEGIATELDLLQRSVRAQFRDAEDQGAPLVLVLGDDELASGTIKLKDMGGHTEETVSSERTRLTLLIRARLREVTLHSVHGPAATDPDDYPPTAA